MTDKQLRTRQRALKTQRLRRLVATSRNVRERRQKNVPPAIPECRCSMGQAAVTVPSVTTSTMSKQFQFKLVLLGMYSARHNINESLICIQANLRLENLGEFIICMHRSSAANNLTSLVLRFVKDQFDDYRESTIGGQ